MEILKLLLCCVLLVNFSSGCKYAGHEYDEGDPVPTEEPCLNCACTRGSLVCHLRICPTLPDPPPRGCLIVHKAQKCCPQLVCEHGFYEDLNNSIEARSGIVSLPELDESSKGCVINGTVYAEGSATDTSSLCQYCYCIRGVQHCVKPKCLLNSPGCSPVYNKLTCCPTKYNCTTRVTPPVKETEGMKEVILLEVNKGCSLDGNHYLEGDKVEGVTNSSCVNCYCIAGKITCEQIICTPPVKHSCRPVYHVDHCCPISYDCNQSALRLNTSTTLASTTTEAAHKIDESSLEYYANISSVNINKNTLDGESESGVENRIITNDEPELNKSNLKAPTEATKPPNSRIENNTRNPSQKLHKNELNSMPSIKKPIEKPKNESNHVLLSTSSNTKTNADLLTKVGTHSKPSVNNTKTYVNNNKTMNKTSTVNNKNKTQNNSTKNALVTNKVVNKIISQSLISSSNKTASTAHVQTSKIKTNNTINTSNKLSDKNTISLRLNQSNIIKPNVEQLVKNQPNRLQGNIIKHNSTSGTATKEYVKLPIKTAISNKNSTQSASLTKYEKISSSNDLSKTANGTTKADLPASNNLKQSVTNTGNDSLKDINQVNPSTESVLKIEDTKTKSPELNSTKINESNATKTDNDSNSTFATSDESVDSSTEVQNEALNTNLTSTEHPSLDNNTSSDSLTNEIKTANETLTTNNEELKNENETIVERTKAGSIDSLESNVTASNVTAGPAVRATMSNKSVDLDYDYDSLPPSLPNLKIIPFVAADAVVDETNSFKREDTESIIPITENPSYLDPFSNFFSPPVRTEGGFVPKEPILDGPYFESKIETASTSVGPVMHPSPSEDLLVAGLDVSSSTADPDFSAPLITFTEFSPEKLIEADYHCLFSSKVFKHGELVSHIDDCKVCVCFYGDIACQAPKCPEVSAGCRRVDSHGGCCGKIECDSNDIISTQIKDRFDEDAHINASSTSGQHRIEYIHLSEHQLSPTGEESNAYDTLANSNADTANGKLTYITTTEEPSIEYISNNKYVIVKPAQNKQTYQTTTYKSILDDILPFFWQSEVESGVKGKNETEKISEVMPSSTTTKLNINENIESSHLQGSNFTDYGTEKINAIDNKHSLPTGDVQTGENDFHLDHDKENTSDKNGSGEDLFSSLLHSFSSMYSSMDSQKQKLKPGNKNNVRIKPIVSHKPSVKTTNNDVSNQHPVHSNLGTFSSSTVKTTTLFIPILRYNSTATKYYSVLETTPELTNKNALNHVQEDTSGEIPGISRTELYNRVTQAPQINHIIENNRHRVKLQPTTETFLVTSKPDISETTYSYFKPSDIVTNRVAPNLLSSSTETIGDTKPHKNQYNYYEPETLEIFKSNIKSDEENESNLHQTVSSDHLLTTTNTLELLDSMQTSTKTYDSSIHRNKTTPPLNKVISTTEKEPDLFSEILGNFFATNDKEAVASNSTKQTTKAPVKSNVLKTTDKPVKDDYEDNFSFDTFLSSWFNDDTPSSTKQPPKKEIESRIDSDIDDPENEEYDEDYNGEIEDSKPILNTTTKQEHQEKHANKEELNRPFKSKEKVANGSENLATTAELTSTAQSTSIKLDNAPDQFDIPSIKDDTYVLVNIRRPPVNETFYGESITNKGKLAEQEMVVKNSVVKIDKLRNNSSNERTDENKADKMENNSKTPNAIKNSETTELNKELHLKANENSNGTNHAKSNDTQTQTEEHKQQSQTDNSEINVEHLASKRDEVSKSTTTVPMTPVSDSTTKGIVQTTPHYEHHELKLNNNSVVQSTKDSLTSTESLSTPTSTASEVPPEATVPIPTTFKPQYKPHPPTTYRFTSTTPRAAEESYRPPTAKPFPSSLESISTTRRYSPPKRPTHTYRPSTYRPKVKFSLPPRSSMRPPPTTAAPAFNPLKIDECNIYGSIYKVGTSIAELSTECLTCLCTSMGVQCSGHCGHP